MLDILTTKEETIIEYTVQTTNNIKVADVA
ncbi:hypothetical protein NIES970_29780 (plasmid) [[Synechococcus] sp. NIES-970]|nr:hypothetical protein NIES970_29780 [[Synechococcus] sp. NIES-970]